MSNFCCSIIFSHFLQPLALSLTLDLQTLQGIAGFGATTGGVIFFCGVVASDDDVSDGAFDADGVIAGAADAVVIAGEVAFDVAEVAVDAAEVAVDAAEVTVDAADVTVDAADVGGAAGVLNGWFGGFGVVGVGGADDGADDDAGDGGVGATGGVLDLFFSLFDLALFPEDAVDDVEVFRAPDSSPTVRLPGTRRLEFAAWSGVDWSLSIVAMPGGAIGSPIARSSASFSS